jgi:glutathione S-transferase
MKLYYTPGACSLSPHIVLREAGLPFTLHKVDLRSKKLESGEDFNAVNPKGYVPALVLDDGTLLTEGAAIVQFIADRQPGAGLAPASGTAERYKLQEWLNFIASEIHKPMGSMFNQAQSADWKEAVKAILGKRLDWLSAQLQNRSYVMGEHYTVADAYLFTVLSWSGAVGFDLGKWPLLQQYSARIAQRPKVVEALQAEGLLKAA